MIRPLLFLVGYEILSADNRDSARIVNLCAQAKIVYRIIGFDGERVRLRVSPLASVRLRILCAKYEIDIKVHSRHGVPAALARFFCRPGLVLGLAVCIFTVALSGRVIWDVRVEGNESVPTEHIKNTLSECGIGVGTKKEGLKLDSIENRFLILSDDISWISVNITGTVAEVEVREVQAAEELPDYAASNLVASRNGTVVSFEQVRGNIAVQIGEAVSEGELLVGGVYGSEDTALRFVRSSGKVFAECERDFCISVPLEFEKKMYTGEQKIKKSLIFFEKEVKLFGNSRNLYESCDIIDEVRYLNFFGLGEIPIGVRTVSYVEYESVTAQRTEQQAREQAIFELWQSFYGQAPDAQQIGKTVNGRMDNGAYILTATVRSIENIAVEKEIELDIVK